MGTVTARELKNRTGAVLSRVRSGETVTVTVRGARVAQFLPLGGRARAAQVREKRKSIRALVKAIGGKYRDLGKLEEFLAEKAREISRER